MGGALPLIGVPSSAAAYNAALEGLVALDEHILSSNPALPPLYEAGVRYRAPRNSKWRHAGEVAIDGWGDCEALSGYRVAELHLSGEDPDARVACYKTGPNTYHAVVQRGDGFIEDPSKILGMRIKNVGVYRDKLAAAFGDENIEGPGDEPILVVGEDPMPDRRTISFDIYHTGQGWAGVLRLPFDLGTSPATALVAHTTESKTPEAAASKAANLTTAVAKSLPPEIQKLIPPAAAAALATATDPKVQAAIKSGNLATVYKALPDSVRSKLPPQVQQAAAVLSNPQLEAFLRSDNPALRAANLLNLTTLARPDIYAQNVAKTAESVKDLGGKALSAVRSLF